MNFMDFFTTFNSNEKLLQFEFKTQKLYYGNTAISILTKNALQICCMAWRRSGQGVGVGLATERSQVRVPAAALHVTTLGKLFTCMCLCLPSSINNWYRRISWELNRHSMRYTSPVSDCPWTCSGLVSGWGQQKWRSGSGRNLALALANMLFSFSINIEHVLSKWDIGLGEFGCHYCVSKWILGYEYVYDHQLNQGT